MRELLLITLEGQQYGIWKDQTRSIEDGMTLHRLPLSPACIAGVCLIEDRSVTIADLPACIGHAPAGREAKGRVLIVSENEKQIGFLVSGDIAICSVTEDDVLPLPGCLVSEAITSCAVLGNRPVPIVDVSSLYRQLVQNGQEPGGAPFSIGRPEKAARDAFSIRLFRLGSSLFAASGSGLQQGSLEHGPIARISSAPVFVKGVLHHDGALLPVIDLSRRLKRKDVEKGQIMLFDAGTVRLALLVDADRGTWSVNNFSVLDLPPIVQSCWLRAAVMHAGAIIPRLDLNELFCPDERPESRLDDRYTPDSCFSSDFKTRDVDVVEFSLLGTRHAVPRTEVDDIAHFKSCRRLPDSPPIVMGVAEHAGKLLPVIDLAMIFGRRSLITPDWKMIVIKNGDFEALVITEAVFGERRLPVDAQRNVPIQLPHGVVYGCYPDAEGVRLVLNVHSLAVHFEKSLVQELLSTVTPDMEKAGAEILSFTDDQTISTLESAEAESDDIVPVATEGASDAGSAEPTSVIEAGPAEDEQPAEQRQESEPQQALEQQDGEQATATAADQQSDHQESEPQQAEQRDEQQVEQQENEPQQQDGEQTLVAAADQQSDHHESDSQQALEQQDPEQATITAPDQQAGQQENEPQVGEQTLVAAAEQQLDHQESDSQQGLEQQDQEQATITAPDQQIEHQEKEQGSLPAVQQPETDQAALSTADEPAIQTVPAAEETLVSNQKPEDMTAASEGGPAQPEETGRTGSEQKEERQRFSSPVPDKAAGEKPAGKKDSEFVFFDNIGRGTSVSVTDDHRERQTGSGVEAATKRWIAYGAVAAVLAALAILLLNLDAGKSTNGQKVGNQMQPAKSEPVRTEPETKVAVKAQEARLELDVPATRPTDIDIYVVVKDDTLWSISERFTGNPFNYPRIAGENRIADPDMIFPGQKIRLKKRK